MSKLIVKKALQIIDSDDEGCSQIKEKKKEIKNVSTHKYGLKKERTRLKLKAKEAKEKGKVIADGITQHSSALEEYRRKQKEDKTAQWIKERKKLHSIKVDKNVAVKILKEIGKLDNKKSQQSSGKKDDQSFFTEDDFQRYVRSLV